MSIIYRKKKMKKIKKYYCKIIIPYNDGNRRRKYSYKIKSIIGSCQYSYK